MSTIAQQESLVKESLFQFITKNVPSADLDVIDDIVLSYVISILEEASQDPCFDVEGFIEMMSAYVPEFADIDAGAVCTWVLELEAELSRRSPRDGHHDESSDSDKISLTLQSLTEMLPRVTKGPRSGGAARERERESPEPRDARSERAAAALAAQCRALHEMFPDTCAMEIKHCVSIAGGDASRAAATLLHRREVGQEAAAAAAGPPRAAPPADDAELRSRIIARYAYVDERAAAREHRPLAPRIEPKKLVRYRDNKIVSLKGERYTEVPRDRDAPDRDLKKPKKQHCP